MLKQLIQLLVNQLVPKRAVNGGGSKLIYGAEATEFGLPDWDNPTVITLSSGGLVQQVYVATSSCFIVLGVLDSVTTGANTTYSLIEIKSNYVTLVRSYRYNNAVNCFLKKGDTVTLQWSGSGARALVYPLKLPN